MKLSLTPLVAALLLVSSAAAQLQVPFSAIGRIVPVSAGACDPTATHQIESTDVLLRSSKVDLSQLEGDIRQIDGTFGLVPANCPTIDVTSTGEPAARTDRFALFGTRIGRPVLFTTFSAPGSIVVRAFSGGPAFLPIGPLGTLLIELPTLVIQSTQISIGIDLYTLNIPNDPALRGICVHYQFGYGSVTNGLEVGLANPGSFMIQ